MTQPKRKPAAKSPEPSRGRVEERGEVADDVEVVGPVEGAPVLETPESHLPPLETPESSAWPPGVARNPVDAHAPKWHPREPNSP